MFTFFCHLLCTCDFMCLLQCMSNTSTKQNLFCQRNLKRDFLPGRKMFNTQGDAYSTDTLSDTLPLGRIAQG